MPLGFFSSCLTSLLRALGDPKPCFYVSLISCLVSIALDLLFVLSLKMGAYSIALSGGIASALSIFACLLFLIRRHKEFLPHKGDWALSWPIMKSSVKNALPNGLQSSLIGVGLFFFQKSINSFGEGAINGYAVSLKALNLSLTVVGAITSSVLVFVSQNKGAKEDKRIASIIKSSSGFLLVYCLVAGFALFAIKPFLTSIFLPSSEAEESSFFCEAVVAYFPLSLTIGSFLSLGRNLLLGIGKGWLSFLSCLSEALARLLFNLFAIPSIGYYGIVYCDILAYGAGLLACLLSLLFIYRAKRSEKRRESIS